MSKINLNWEIRTRKFLVVDIVDFEVLQGEAVTFAQFIENILFSKAFDDDLFEVDSLSSNNHKFRIGKRSLSGECMQSYAVRLPK